MRRRRRGFTTRWTVAGDVAARTITLPLNNGNGSAFNCIVNWGDGTNSTITAYDDANRSHTYASDGTYDVEIRGTCEGWSFNNGGDKLKIAKILFWGDRPTFGGFKYLVGAFYGCANLATWGFGKIPPSGSGPTSLQLSFNGTGVAGDVPSDFISLVTHSTSIRDMFSASSITTVTDRLLSRNLLLTDVYAAFYGCGLLTELPGDFYRNNTEIVNFRTAHYLNSKLRLSASAFYREGEQATRFLNKSIDFFYCFYRTSFTGVQGTAPDLWNCDYGETITLDVAPATDWDGGDTITGQTSGATAVVVAKVSAVVYKIKKHFGTFTLGEVIGVTGVANKLADQGAAKPTFVGTPISAGCFGGAGNSSASLSNYADIPASWK